MNRKKIMGLILATGMAVNVISPFAIVTNAETSEESVKEIAGFGSVTIVKAGKN